MEVIHNCGSFHMETSTFYYLFKFWLLSLSQIKWILLQKLSHSNIIRLLSWFASYRSDMLKLRYRDVSEHSTWIWIVIIVKDFIKLTTSFFFDGWKIKFKSLSHSRCWSKFEWAIRTRKPSPGTFTLLKVAYLGSYQAFFK